MSGALWPYFLLIVFGFLPSEIWRWLSVILSHGIDEGSQIFTFLKTVATVLLVGVVARLIFAPTGELAHVPLAARIGALALAGGVFAITRRNVLAAVLTGEAAIIAAGFWFLR
ncbi:MAG: AzlD domain-containing protein [Hyphomicrobiales bacterium]|nr:AzlD domain-containing protein [Hyphomicrobiales bacterium]